MDGILTAIYMFLSVNPSGPDREAVRMCREIGYDNWRKLVYKKGEVVKVECYNKEWKKQELVIK